MTAPKVVRQEITKNPVTKSVTQCPAVLDFDRRYFVINSPIDLHMRWEVKDGQRNIINMLYEKSPIRPEALAQMVVIPAAERMAASGASGVADADVLHLRFRRSGLHQPVPAVPPLSGRNFRPGVQINGRFPIDIWPRALHVGLRMARHAKDLILKRGEPLFYVTLRGPGPVGIVRLIEAKKTPELESLCVVHHGRHRMGHPDLFPVQDGSRASAGAPALPEGRIRPGANCRSRGRRP